MGYSEMTFFTTFTIKMCLLCIYKVSPVGGALLLRFRIFCRCIQLLPLFCPYASKAIVATSRKDGQVVELHFIILK